MRDVIIIAAVAKNGVIGRGGKMPWHISDDFRRFKRLTEGHTVIMGRATWESLPGKPLAGRKNIVLSRNSGFKADGAVVVRTLTEAFGLAGVDDKVFVIGGASVYAEAMPIATMLELTRLEKEVDGDVRFPDFDEDQWTLDGREEKFDPVHGAYSFCTYKRKK